MAKAKGKVNLINMIREEAKRSGVASALARFVLLRNPGSVRIRFLDDLAGDPDDQAYAYYIHDIRSSSNDEFRRALCMRQFDEPCALCRTGLNRKMVVAFRVFDYGDKTVKVLELRPGSMAMEDLVNYFDEHGTVTDADFVYKRVGTGLRDTRYSIILKEKGPFKFRKTAKRTWITKEELEKLIQARYAGREEGNKAGRKGGEEDESSEEE